MTDLVEDVLEQVLEQVGRCAEGQVHGVKLVVTVKRRADIRYSMFLGDRRKPPYWRVHVDAPDFYGVLVGNYEAGQSFTSKADAMTAFEELVKKHGLKEQS